MVKMPFKLFNSFQGEVLSSHLVFKKVRIKGTEFLPEVTLIW